jgi:two-component system, LytTR family, sensor kinase
LEVTISVLDEHLTWRLPPLTIKTVIENAIAHNTTSEKHPLSIWLYTDLKAQLIVNHTLQPKVLLVKRKRQGLVNLMLKYKLLLKKDIIIEESETECLMQFALTEPISDYVLEKT